jgi:hypothetical protein
MAPRPARRVIPVRSGIDRRWSWPQALPAALRTALFVRHDITDKIDRADITPPMERNDPMEKKEPAEPTLPMDSTDPTEPTESTDPRDPMERTESRDHRDKRELSTVFDMCVTLLGAFPSSPASSGPHSNLGLQ